VHPGRRRLLAGLVVPLLGLVAGACSLIAPVTPCDEEHPCVFGETCREGLCTSGVRDAGSSAPRDAGDFDAGFDDRDDPEAGVLDDGGVAVDGGQAEDAGPLDAGPLDAGDGGRADAGPLDAGSGDAGFDAGVDAGLDAGDVDAGCDFLCDACDGVTYSNNGTFCTRVTRSGPGATCAANVGQCPPCDVDFDVEDPPGDDPCLTFDAGTCTGAVPPQWVINGGGSCGSGCVCDDAGAPHETDCSIASGNEDGDGSANCSDSDCIEQSCDTDSVCRRPSSGIAACYPAVETLCGDGEDNDGDDCADELDPDCDAGAVSCSL
jgi:hypothetical protein